MFSKIRKTKKIPCYVLVFDQIDIIKKSLDFLTKFADELDIIVIENPSSNTPKIRKIIEDYGSKKLVKRYYLFSENITNNAYDKVLSREISIIKKSSNVLVTDGDLVCSNKNWIEEELGIINNNREVFACGVSLDVSNLPTDTFPEAKEWIPPDIGESNDCYEAKTGCHLLLFRGKELHNFMIWKKMNRRFFTDGELHRYCYNILGKKWARTKISKAQHLTWDLYTDKNHPYTIMKLENSFQDTWYHRKDSSFAVQTY